MLFNHHTSLDASLCLTPSQIFALCEFFFFFYWPQKVHLSLVNGFFGLLFEWHFSNALLHITKKWFIRNKRFISYIHSILFNAQCLLHFCYLDIHLTLMVSVTPKAILLVMLKSQLLRLFNESNTDSVSHFWCLNFC